MRCLFTVHPLIGHFHAMVPLAQALKEQGHAVAFATNESFGSVVKGVGFSHFPCGRDSDGGRHALEELPEWPEISAKVPPGGIRQLWGFIQGFGPKMVDDLRDLIPDWKPDVIVRDPTEFGSTIVAELFALPYVSIQWAIYISTWGCDEPLTALRRRYGLPVDPHFDSFDRYLALNALPYSWALLGDVSPVTHRFCMPPFDQSLKTDLPDWVHTLPDQPTVYATLGTTFNQDPARFQALIAALSSEDINTIITVGHAVDPAQFHPLPANVRIEQYIPQTLLLPYCDALVFHGGFNSLHSALWQGLPVVVTPLGAGDQQPASKQCAEVGIGIHVEGNPPEPEVIRAAVKNVLDDPSYRQRAREFQRAMKGLPDLSDAVRRLERLAQTKKPQINERF